MINREEAKQLIETSYDEDDHLSNMKAIDKIYDDFDRRTCENCRNLFGCATFKFVEYEYDEEVATFGCTSWVSK